MAEVENDILDEVDISDLLNDAHKLILVNDNHNSFEHVIECLLLYCGHSQVQAEQCAFITHNKGKCSVKEGTLDYLKGIKDALINEKLTAKIE